MSLSDLDATAHFLEVKCSDIGSETQKKRLFDFCRNAYLTSVEMGATQTSCLLERALPPF